jgi:2-keto-4-pentenoate hydratase/2-oxohepta-3-ene-1,7-dioic acid hydratase in catechol pathway
MRLANVNGRAVLLTADDRGIDVALVSAGKFGPTLPQVYEDWASFCSWAETAPTDTQVVTFERRELGPPSPAPRQILAVGLNYRAHAAESGFEAPDQLPPTFTKFTSSLAGPEVDVVLPSGGNTDWEVELVAVIGQTVKSVEEDQAWGCVAGLTVGQDISERIAQHAGPAPQFSLGKSYPNFAPTGPWLVTPDAVPDRDDLALGAAIDGSIVQDGRTRDLIFSVPSLISKLSQTMTLLPGDLIFTGTPAGVGFGRNPQRFLQHGEELRSWIEGIGEMRQVFVQEQD